MSLSTVCLSMDYSNFLASRCTGNPKVMYRLGIPAASSGFPKLSLNHARILCLSFSSRHAACMVFPLYKRVNLVPSFREYISYCKEQAVQFFYILLHVTSSTLAGNFPGFLILFYFVVDINHFLLSVKIDLWGFFSSSPWQIYGKWLFQSTIFVLVWFGFFGGWGGGRSSWQYRQTSPD